MVKRDKKTYVRNSVQDKIDIRKRRISLGILLFVLFFGSLMGILLK